MRCITTAVNSCRRFPICPHPADLLHTALLPLFTPALLLRLSSVWRRAIRTPAISFLWSLLLAHGSRHSISTSQLSAPIATLPTTTAHRRPSSAANRYTQHTSSLTSNGLTPACVQHPLTPTPSSRSTARYSTLARIPASLAQAPTAFLPNNP